MTDFQGRTPEHQARNEQACATILLWTALMLLLAFSVSVGGWLVATVAGWM